MKRAGQVVLFRFPQTDLISGKLRPALLIEKVPGPHDDWLICMISSQIQQSIPDFDEMVEADSEDFTISGLKVRSVIRIGRLAVVEGTVLLGVLGEISVERLQRIRNRLAAWLTHP
jgi:mRNA interferase MazF